MKATGQLLQFKKCIILFMTGVISSALAYALYAINPIDLIFDWQLTMAPTSTVFTLWRQPPIDVFLKVFIFNITNPDEFMRGEEKLRVEEIGPYVYQELLENANVVWNDNGSMSYTPKRTVIFRRDMSVNDPEKVIVRVPNVPMLGISSAVHKAGFLVNFPLAQLAYALDSKPILNISVYEYLWGYEDSLVRLASGIVPSFIDFQKFGLLDRMYNEGDNVVNLNIQKNKNMSDENGRYLSILNYNNSPGLKNWGYVEETDNQTDYTDRNTICNRIRGATEGSLFPTNIDKKAVFRVFRKAFCRAIPIVFNREVVTQSGLPGYEYILTDNFLDTPEENPENECYCRQMDKCLKKGLSDLTPCYYNIPAAISLPHFLNADPSLLEDVDGLKPDPKLHETKVIIQPSIGMPMEVNSRLQTNLVMQETVYNPRIEVFNNLVIPLFWTDFTIPPVDNFLITIMKLLLQVGPLVQTILIIILSIVGVTTFILSLIGMLWILNQHSEETLNDERRDSMDLRIPLGYTAIRILPAIKKITSKTDLFG